MIRMNFENCEESDYDLNLDLLIILYQLCVTCPMQSEVIKIEQVTIQGPSTYLIRCPIK